jgi:hypothetical protein
MTDKFAKQYSVLGGPAKNAFAITPSDTNNLPTASQYIYVGGDGDLTVVLVGDTDPVLFKHVKAGTVLPLRATKVLHAGTDATDLVALL